MKNRSDYFLYQQVFPDKKIMKKFQQAVKDGNFSSAKYININSLDSNDFSNDRKIKTNNLTYFGYDTSPISPIYQSQAKSRSVKKGNSTNSTSEEELNTKIKEYVQELCKKYSKHAKNVPIVPERVELSFVLEENMKLNNIPIGINKETIEKEYYDFSEFTTIVSSNEEDLPNDFIRSLTKLMSNISNTSFILLDINENLKGQYSNNVSHVNNNYDEVLKKIIDNMKMQYDIYVNDGYDNKNLGKYRNIMIIMNKFSKILLKII